MVSYSKKTIEQKKEEMNAILEQLEEGVKGVFTSENFINYLDTFSKFHNYSIGNIILIMMQFPSAPHVASFNDWNKKFNRVVKKGEKGIRILVPTPKKLTKEREVTNPDGTVTFKVEVQAMQYRNTGDDDWDTIFVDYAELSTYAPAEPAPSTEVPEE